MNDRFRQAFDAVHAPEDLKLRTEKLLSRRLAKNAGPSKTVRRYAAAFCALGLVLGALGGWLYFTPVSAISIDVNPSLELNINRFDQVVSVDSFNDGGRSLAESLDLRFKDYASAIGLLLSEEEVESYLKQGEGLSILVVCDDPDRSEKMLAAVQSCTGGQKHVHCHSDTSENTVSAHAAGLSCGKYRAYLELYALDPNVTPQDISEWTMREIRERIRDLSREKSAPQAEATPEPDASPEPDNSPKPDSASNPDGASAASPSPAPASSRGENSSGNSSAGNADGQGSGQGSGHGHGHGHGGGNHHQERSE